MLLRVILYALLIYVTYKVIFDLILPVYKTTQKIKKGFRNMHSQMQDQPNQHPSSQRSNSAKSTSKEKAGDYIDFEEVK
jgi:hypothetical protein